VQITLKLKPEAFEDLLKDNVKDYKKTKALRAKAGVAAGENYATIMLRLELDVETKGTLNLLKKNQKIKPKDLYFRQIGSNQSIHAKNSPRH